MEKFVSEFSMRASHALETMESGFLRVSEIFWVCFGCDCENGHGRQVGEEHMRDRESCGRIQPTKAWSGLGHDAGIPPNLCLI